MSYGYGYSLDPIPFCLKILNPIIVNDNITMKSIKLIAVAVPYCDIPPKAVPKIYQTGVRQLFTALANPPP